MLYLSSRCIFSSVHHEPVRVSSRQVEISFTRAICEANSACRATGLPRGPKNDRLKSKNRAFDNSRPSQILWSSCCLRNRTSSAPNTRPAKALPGYLISKHRGSPEKPKACHCSFARKDASDACKLRGHSTPESHGRSDLSILMNNTGCLVRFCHCRKLTFRSTRREGSGELACQTCNQFLFFATLQKTKLNAYAKKELPRKQ